MSEDGDVDVESAEDVPDIGVEATATTINSNGGLYRGGGSHDKRAHHNALERRRRDHIKDSFHGLRDCIPSLVGEKVSRAHILNKATEYIRHMQKGGSTREDDICELAKKNEILEEQVRALEEARALGGSFSAEDLLQGVASRVQARQTQEMMQQLQKNNAKSTKQSSKSKAASGQASTNATSPSTPSPNPAPSEKPGQKPATNATTATTTNAKDPPTSGPSSQQPLPAMNLLASNIQSTQSLLKVLQKNLSPNSNLPPNIKSLAARVLASPLIRGAQQKTSQASPIHRGFVTATTVPKGSNLSSSPSTPPSKPASSISTGTTTTTTTNLPNADSAKNRRAPPTTTTTTTTTTMEQGTETDHSVNGQSLLKTTSTGGEGSSVVNSTPLLATQLLEAHDLLQQQGGLLGGGASELGEVPPPAIAPPPPAVVGGSGSAPSLQGGITTPQGLHISPELLAQVSSLLNLPTVAATPLTPSATPTQVGSALSSTTPPSVCDGDSSLFTSQDTLSQPPSQATPTTTLRSTSSSHKRPAPLSETATPTAKKAHIEQ